MTMRLPIYLLGFLFAVAVRTPNGQEGRPLDPKVSALFTQCQQSDSSKPAPYRAQIERSCNKRESEPHISIVGGEDIQISRASWHAGLINPNEHDVKIALFCGGAVYSATAVVTAAHCVKGLINSEIDVIAGTDLLDQTVTRYEVKAIRIHPLYDPGTRDNDVAVILLNTPLTGSKWSEIHPISESDERAIDSRSDLSVTGWGLTSENGKKSTTLKSVFVQIEGNNTCRMHLNQGETLTQNMLCAGAPGKDACTYDSGGPLVIGRMTATHYLVGIVSGGDGCARKGRYGIYTRAAVYAAWIADRAVGK